MALEKKTLKYWEVTKLSNMDMIFWVVLFFFGIWSLLRLFSVGRVLFYSSGRPRTPMLALNEGQSSCLSLPSAGMNHDTQPKLYFLLR